MFPLSTVHTALENRSRERPSKPLIYHHGDTYTYAQTQELVERFSAYLVSEGVKKGDRICLALPRNPQIVISIIAAGRIGALAVPVNYMLNRSEVNGFVRTVKPSVLVATAKLFDLLDGDVMTGGVKTVTVGGERSGAVPWEKAVSCGGRTDVVEGVGQTAYLNYTTGSTGRPKGGVCTHENIYWNTRAAVEAFNITQDDVHLCMFASFAHPHELFARPIYTGGSMTLLEEISPKAITRTVSAHGVTCLMGLAPMYKMMTEHCCGERIESLRVAESGGMYTMPEINHDFQRCFGVPILSVWGSTETTGIATANTMDGYRTDGSMGRPLPHYEIRVVDEDGAEVGEGGIGEMLVKGGGVIPSYYERDAGLCVTDGWLHTGDLVRRGEDGFLYFVERTSGMLKIAGLKAYPAQIEIEMLAHPAIASAAVIGVVDKLRGVTPMAFVTMKEGKTADEDGIKSFLRQRIAAYMIPRKIEILDDLPKIGSGKINKKALKEAYLASKGADE